MQVRKFVRDVFIVTNSCPADAPPAGHTPKMTRITVAFIVVCHGLLFTADEPKCVVTSWSVCHNAEAELQTSSVSSLVCKADS